MRPWAWRIIGYALLVCGVVVAFGGLIPLSARNESGGWTWGWPETVVLVVAVLSVLLGLTILGTRRLTERSPER